MSDQDGRLEWEGFEQELARSLDLPLDLSEARLASIEADRLARVLDAIDEGEDPRLDAREDPELASLVATAARLRETASLSVDESAFHSYHQRSRAYILDTLAQRGVARPRVVPFYRRWSTFGTLASTAAAAVFAVALLLNGDGSTGQVSPLASQQPIGPAPENQTSEAVDSSLQRLSLTIAQVSERTQRGEKVDAALLRELASTNAALAQRIASEPQSMPREQVVDYIQAAADSRDVLAAAQPEEGGESALDAAQAAAEDGVVAATRYLADQDDTDSGADVTPTEEATPSPTVIGEPPPSTSTGTPVPTSTPAPSPTGTPTAPNIGTP